MFVAGPESGRSRPARHAGLESLDARQDAERGRGPGADHSDRMTNTRLAFTQRDPKGRGATRSRDPLIQAFHEEWLTRDYHERHDVLDVWCAMADEQFYGEGHSYLEAMIRLSTLWLHARRVERGGVRSPEQVARLARAHGRKAQDVRRDLERLMLEREVSTMIAREKFQRRYAPLQDQASTHAHQLSVALAEALDDEDDE